MNDDFLGDMIDLIREKKRSNSLHQDIVKPHKDHPERGESEVFVCDSLKRQFSSIGWKSKRMGITPIPDKKEADGALFYPVFVVESEMEKNGWQRTDAGWLAPNPFNRRSPAYWIFGRKLSHDLRKLGI